MSDVFVLGRRAFSTTYVSLTVGVMIIGLLLVGGFFAPLPHDAINPDTNNTLAPPSLEHWFGTDGLGRDVFSRVVRGARLDVPIALGGMVFSLVLGVPLGLIASHKSKGAERVMRALDIFQTFPLLVLAIVIVALTGNGARNIIAAIAILNVPRFIRLVRSEALSLRESRFIEAAISIGASPTRVMVRHLLPNMMGTILVQASLTAAQAIVIIAGMSFIGIGVTPPTPSWGAMIQTGAANVTTGQWWISTFPGLAVFVAVFAFNQIADGLDATVGRGANA